MRRLVTGTVRLALRLALAALLGALLVVAIGITFYVRSLPELDVWHTVDLDEEYERGSDVDDLAGYLALEERLFEQLDREVYGATKPADATSIQRYRRGSLADPGRWPTDWNRTFEIVPASPRAGVLLLHGLSDAPYSLLPLGEALAESGAHVLGLRIPGHGTAPSGLTSTGWRDMAGAVRIAVRHLHERVGDSPVHVVGYSNGGALALEYALASLSDPALPPVSRMVLLSPEIGISPLAALAVWLERAGRLLGIEKLEWQSLGFEYNPFKYVSFAINAGVLAHEITEHLRREIARAAADGTIDGLPPILAFQSGVDATVSAAALVSTLFVHLDDGNDELVLFDVNRLAGLDELLAYDPVDTFEPLLRDRDRGFALSWVSNTSPEVADVSVTRVEPDGSAISTLALGARWPAGVYSLSHVAPPFPPDDPLYGGPDASESPGIALGHAALRGERGVLHISSSALLRMSWNPFYDFVEHQTVSFLSEP